MHIYRNNTTMWWRLSYWRDHDISCVRGRDEEVLLRDCNEEVSEFSGARLNEVFKRNMRDRHKTPQDEYVGIVTVIYHMFILDSELIYIPLHSKLNKRG